MHDVFGRHVGDGCDEKAIHRNLLRELAHLLDGHYGDRQLLGRGVADHANQFVVANHNEKGLCQEIFLLLVGGVISVAV